MTNRDAEIVAGVRRGLDAFSRGDFDAVVKNIHPEIELVPPTGGEQTLKGAARVRAWMEPDAFESNVVEPLDFRVVANKLLVRTRSHIKGAGSGIEVDALSWAVLTYDEAGLVTRIEIYLDHQEAEALEALGLSEQDAHADS
jgi:ketosteroid isomerase-like protein